MQFPDEIQGQSTGRPEKVRTVDWIPLFVYPDLVLVVVCGRDKCCLSVRFTCLLCIYVLCYVRFAEKITEVTKTSETTRFKCRFAEEHLTWLWTI